MTEKNLLNLIAWTPLVLLAVLTPLVAWWLFEPVPVEVRYVAPNFVSEPVDTAEQAEAKRVVAVKGGTVVYRFVEYCVRRPFTGTARRSWVSPALVWHAPDVPTSLSRERGCAAANLSVEAPTSSPSRTFAFVQRMEIPMNPLRTAVIEYPPIPLTILDSE